MCGIIGYSGFRDVKPVLVNGLKRLEYRGYDSCGVSISSGSGLKTLKDKGRIAELEKDLGDINRSLGIAHTRWATHGEPTKTNAHPHLDCNENISIAHNGIIENHSSLRKYLEDKGHKFSSETDSEVIAHLLEEFYDGDIERSLIEAVKLIEGAYGIVAVHKNENRLVAARKGSPLIIGVEEGESFVASDIPAILDYTRNVIYLKDGEVASLSKGNYSVKHLNGDKVDKEVHEVEWTIDQLEKGNYKHFMLKEIFEQPSSISDTLRGRMKDDIKLSLDVDFNLINRIVIVACGTSWHAASIGKFLIEKFARVPVEVDYASEFRYRDPILRENDLVVGISQSGETADTLAAIKEANSKGAKTIGIVNVVGSTITREVNSGIYLHAGPEIGVASTKAFTSQVVALTILSLYVRQERKMDMGPYRKFIEELKDAPEKISEALEENENIRNLAEKFKDKSNFLYFGRGINFPVALEGALKLKEISYIHAEGYAAAEMKHGPLALVDEDMPVVFVATKSELSDKILSNMQEVKARKGKIISVMNVDDERVRELSDYIIKVPEVSEQISPIINSIPLQLLAYHIADLKGLNVDKPRNLAKSVTVE